MLCVIILSVITLSVVTSIVERDIKLAKLPLIIGLKGLNTLAYLAKV
jgi:hypothetical protein